MGQKIHPIGFRLSVTRAWASRWYASRRNFAGMLAEDLDVREYLKKKLKNAAVSRILIERPAKNARITIFSARPGVVIGKKGEDIENLKAELARRLKVPVAGLLFVLSVATLLWGLANNAFGPEHDLSGALAWGFSVGLIQGTMRRLVNGGNRR